MPPIRTSILSIGRNKGLPRIWLEGQHLQLAGFTPGRKVRTTYGNNEIVVTLASTGDHTVTPGRKAAGRRVASTQDKEPLRAQHSGQPEDPDCGQLVPRP